MNQQRFILPVRIIVEAPVPGVAIALQEGKTAEAHLIGPTLITNNIMAFEFDLIVDGVLRGSRARLLGPLVQGRPEERFVYLCVGSLAGQSDSEWSRRIKVPLADITAELASMGGGGRRLEGRVAGRGKDGGPACASVPLLSPGW